MNVCKFALVMLTVISSASAMAAGKPLADFNEVRQACKDPAKYQNQIAPSNIQITCTDVQYNWLPAGNGNIEMATKRFITSALASDKYTVSPNTQEIKSGAQMAACPRFKEVTETVSVPKGLSCDEILSYAGSATDYCLALVNDVRANNPNAVAVAETGRLVDTCNGSAVVAPAPTNPSKPGRGQR